MELTHIKEKLFHFDAKKEIEKKHGLIFFAFLLCVAATIFILIGYSGEAVRDYYYYGDAIFNGVLPYQPYNDLNWEYPPLAYLFLTIPRLFASDPTGYQVAFTVMMLIFALVGLYLVRRISLVLNKNANLMMTIYFLSAIMMIQFFFDRFDVIASVFALAAVCLYIEKHYPLAFFILVLGLFVKIYPGLLFPILLIPFLASRDMKGAMAGTVVFLMSSILILMPFMMWSPDNFLSFISYHSDRGIQIESVASSFILFLEMLGLTSTQTVSESWAYSLQGGLADIISPIMLPMLFIFLCLFCILYFVHCKSKRRDEAYSSVMWASFAIVMVFVVFNKVFSVQYMVWILFLLFPLLTWEKRPETSRRTQTIFIAAIITTVAVEIVYKGLCYHDPFAIMILLIRNLLIVALMVYVIRTCGLFDRTKDIISSRFKIKRDQRANKLD